MKPKSTKKIAKTPTKDESSLACEASITLKHSDLKVDLKLRFYFILNYVLLATLFGENHLLLTLREAFLFLISE